MEWYELVMVVTAMIAVAVITWAVNRRSRKKDENPSAHAGVSEGPQGTALGNGTHEGNGMRNGASRPVPPPMVKPRWNVPVEYIAPVMVFLVGIWVLTNAMPADTATAALLTYGSVMAAIVITMLAFTFIWITRRVSLPYWRAWRKGDFIRLTFSGNDAILIPQAYGSGVIFTSDGELKAYLSRDDGLYRCGAVDICPVLDEAGVTASPKMVAALEQAYNAGYTDYAELRAGYKDADDTNITNETNIEIPQPVVINFRRLKSFIMGITTSSLLYGHTDYWADKKMRMKMSLLQGKGSTLIWIVFVAIAIAIVIFALSMTEIL